MQPFSLQPRPTHVIHSHTSSTNLLLLLPLNLVREVKVGLIKLMHTHISILTSRRITLSVRVDGDGVERAEMTTHATNLLLKHLVVEARLEFTLASRSGGDVHGSLAATEDDEVFLGGDGSGVEGGVGDVGLHNLEIGGIDDLGM